MRRSKRLDYKQLHLTGEKVIKYQSQSQNNINNIDENMSEKVLILDIESLSEDINDFIDENPTNEHISYLPEELDKLLETIQIYRSTFRRKHKELSIVVEGYDEKYGKQVNEKMTIIKQYIKAVSITRQQMRVGDNRTLHFQVEEIYRMMDELHTALDVDLSTENDRELTKRKEETNYHNKCLMKMGDKIEKVMKAASSGMTDVKLEDINQRYEDIIALKNDYVKMLKEEANLREVEKHESFETSLLNVKIPKFKGLASSIDIYTFKDLFEKVHLKSTPTTLLPDLVKNNFLENPALSLVKNVNKIDEIWDRLKSAYGDCKTLLRNKLGELSSLDGLWKFKDPGKVVEGLGKIVNCMKDLLQLAERHDIENKLFFGDALERIYRLLGDGRITRWLALDLEAKLEGKALWLKLIQFLEKEIRINQQKILIQNNTTADIARKPTSLRNQSHHVPRNPSHHIPEGTQKEVTNFCFICGDKNHVLTNGPGASKLVQYFVCPQFVRMTPSERFDLLKSKGLCFQCLFPGAEMKGKHREGKCQRDFCCRNPYHDRYPTKKHVLVCNEHKEENKELLEHYKSRCIFRQRQVELPVFTKDIHLYIDTSKFDNADIQPSDESYATNVLSSKDNHSSINDKAVYMLQTIKVDDQVYSVFYDTGCGDFIAKYSAVKRLKSHATEQSKGPITVGGVGGLSMSTPYGTYIVRLPLGNGSEAMMSGICMEQITAKFPMYPLQGKVEDDIRTAYRKTGQNYNELPKLPKHVGGDTDFMIGIKYLRYFPEKIFQLPSGLTIYKSHFKNADGTYGVIGGPHQIFTEIEKFHHLAQSRSFLSNQRNLFKFGYQINPDVSLLGFKENIHDLQIDESQIDNIHQQSTNENDNIEEAETTYLSRKIKIFNQVENVGSEITFRCVRCRSCQDCKNHDHDEAVSIREEVEQDLINRTVRVDLDRRITIASLPLMHDPIAKLNHNKEKALKVYQQQLGRLENHPDDKEAVMKSEQKLQSLGHVDYVRNLPTDLQNQLRNNKIQNFIPWRVVWKENSTTTPCRIVFDASQPTSSGFSLNDIIAKGRNNMNRLVEIFIRWRIHQVGYHTDIQKMYNSIKLEEKDWCLQRYLWQKELEPGKLPEEKVIKTLIYGVKSSGNQAERGLRQTAKMFENQYPEVYETVSKDIYVDDCLSGGRSTNEVREKSDKLETVVNNGGYTLKGITVSGKDPSKTLSHDGSSISVGGHKWYPKIDELALDIKELNFAKKSRGRKPKLISEVPTKLTRRQCTSKVAEIFDLTGMITPITATLKMDLHELVVRKFGWDDDLPDNLRQIWSSHFEMISELQSIRYKRAVIPIDAESLDATTLDFGDASKDMVCIAIYIRFKRKCGLFSCQLIFARSRLVPDQMSQPRAELYAALVNTHAGEVVRKALIKFHRKSIKFTDSQIALYWIVNETRPLKLWVRNRVIEIQRFTNTSGWKYVKSSDMAADLGTRQCLNIDEVRQDSLWINGMEWMRGEEEHFPMMSAKEIVLSQKELKDMKTESPIEQVESNYHADETIMEKVSKRYEFSNFIIDPNHRRWDITIRILATVMRFIKILQQRVSAARQNLVKHKLKDDSRKMILSEVEIKNAEKYFFKKATSEVKHFMKPNQYKHFTQERDGVMMYTGRILPTDDVTVVGKATEVMKDLCSTMFCVPVLESNSPIAYSVVSNIHWNDPTVRHQGIETVWRQVLKKVYIIEGRNLVKKIKADCKRCRYLEKKLLEVVMGPISPHNITIAPPFYYTQVDLTGSFPAYSIHHKRTTVKIWLLVFCCATTSATNIKVMDSYSTPSFLKAFMRFACEVGYPKKILPDEGSQLIKGCESMRLDFLDLKYSLQKDAAVEFEVCPVGGHNMHGKVERKIREIKKSLERSLSTNRLSMLEWETVAATIANSINNLPLALKGTKSSFESMDLITPNRLMLGRNNDRSPTGTLKVSCDYSKIIRDNEKIFNSWFEIWLTSHVPKLMDCPKWYRSNADLKQGDVVLFVKQESIISSNYQFGIVKDVEYSRDSKIRKVKVMYRNSNEQAFRETYRSVRSLVVIHRIGELSLMEELFDANKNANKQSETNM